MDISKETSRQIGLVINRRGLIEYVIVRDNRRIEIPPFDGKDGAGAFAG